MKHIDQVRGFQRAILMGDTPGHATSGGTAVTGCVVEVVRMDPQGACPVLSLRFYDKPVYSYKTATESAGHGHPLCDEDTRLGVELNLGPELAQSLLEQINARWPEFVREVQDYNSDDEPKTV